MNIDTTGVRRIVVEMNDGSEKVTEIKPPLKLRPDVGDKYWFLSADGSAIKSIWTGVNYQENVWQSGAGFFTKEEAQLASKRRELDQRYREFLATINHREGWVCDWSDYDQPKKCFSRREHPNNRVVFTSVHFHQKKPTAYYFKPRLEDEVRAEFSDADLALIHTGEQL